MLSEERSKPFYDTFVKDIIKRMSPCGNCKHYRFYRCARGSFEKALFNGIVKCTGFVRGEAFEW